MANLEEYGRENFGVQQIASELFLEECMGRSLFRIASAGRVDNWPGFLQVLISNLWKIIGNNRILINLFSKKVKR